MNLKDQFKKAYTDEPMEWDKEELWGDIEKELPPVEKKRRKFFIWWFAGLSTLGIVLLLAMNISSDKESEGISTIDNTKVVEQKITKASNAQTNDIESSLTAEKLTNKEDLEDVLQVDTQTSVNTKNESKNVEELSSTREKFTQPIIKANANNTLGTKSSKALRNSNTTQINQNDNSTLNNTPSTITEDIKPNSKQSNILVNTEGNEPSKISALNKLALYPAFIEYESKKIDEKELANNIAMPLINSNDTESNGSPIRFFELAMALSAGPGISSLSTNNLSNENYVESLQANKDLQETIGASAMLRRKISKHWKLGLGINYRRSFEWFTYTKLDVTTEDVETENAQFYIANGEQVPVPGTVIQTTTRPSLVRTPVKRNYIDLNVELGYIFNLKNSNLYPYISANPNLLHRYKGSSLDINQKILQAGDERQDLIYKKGKVHSFSYGLDWNKEIKDNLQLSIGLRSTHNVASSILLDNTINERHSDFRMRVGLIYDL